MRRPPHPCSLLTHPVRTMNHRLLRRQQIQLQLRSVPHAPNPHPSTLTQKFHLTLANPSHLPCRIFSCCPRLPVSTPRHVLIVKISPTFEIRHREVHEIDVIRHEPRLPLQSFIRRRLHPDEKTSADTQTPASLGPQIPGEIPPLRLKIPVIPVIPRNSYSQPGSATRHSAPRRQPTRSQINNPATPTTNPRSSSAPTAEPTASSPNVRPPPWH